MAFLVLMTFCTITLGDSVEEKFNKLFRTKLYRYPIEYDEKKFQTKVVTVTITRWHGVYPAKAGTVALALGVILMIAVVILCYLRCCRVICNSEMEPTSTNRQEPVPQASAPFVMEPIAPGGRITSPNLQSCPPPTYESCVNTKYNQGIINPMATQSASAAPPSPPPSYNASIASGNRASRY